VKKSTDTSCWMWLSTNVRQVWRGDFRCRTIYLLTVVSPMSIQSSSQFSVDPWCTLERVDGTDYNYAQKTWSATVKFGRFLAEPRSTDLLKQSIDSLLEEQPAYLQARIVLKERDTGRSTSSLPVRTSASLMISERLVFPRTTVVGGPAHPASVCGVPTFARRHVYRAD